VKRQIPNALTLLRIVLTVLLVFAILRQPIIWIGEVAILFALILATDIIDGPIARRTHTVSRFGSVLDIFADIFYVLATTTALVIRDILPLIVLLCIVAELTVYFVTTRVLERRSSAERAVDLVSGAAEEAAVHTNEEVATSWDAEKEAATSWDAAEERPLPIERIGKAVALFYFALPPLALLAAWGFFAEWPIPALTVLCIVLTLLAIANRLRLVIVSK